MTNFHIKKKRLDIIEKSINQNNYKNNNNNFVSTGNKIPRCIDTNTVPPLRHEPSFYPSAETHNEAAMLTEISKLYLKKDIDYPITIKGNTQIKVFLTRVKEAGKEDLKLEDPVLHISETITNYTKLQVDQIIPILEKRLFGLPRRWKMVNLTYLYYSNFSSFSNFLIRIFRFFRILVDKLASSICQTKSQEYNT